MIRKQELRPLKKEWLLIPITYCKYEKVYFYLNYL